MGRASQHVNYFQIIHMNFGNVLGHTLLICWIRLPAALKKKLGFKKKRGFRDHVLRNIHYVLVKM